jgi:hypothetical protein
MLAIYIYSLSQSVHMHRLAAVDPAPGSAQSVEEIKCIVINNTCYGVSLWTELVLTPILSGS